MQPANDHRYWLDLFRKQQDGTITEPETAALQQHCDDIAQQTFDACPVCHGAFSQSAARVRPFRCPNCLIELAACSGDMLPHQPHEVDESLTEQPLLGEFAVWYYPAGCTPCACGVNEAGYFPAAYSCCPSLLALAGEMYSGGNRCAYDFLCNHSETLINALRGDFDSLFNVDHLTRFIHDPQQPTCGPVIQEILRKRSGII